VITTEVNESEIQLVRNMGGRNTEKEILKKKKKAMKNSEYNGHDEVNSQKPKAESRGVTLVGYVGICSIQNARDDDDAGIRETFQNLGG
jgi:hypothetical protein